MKQPDANNKKYKYFSKRAGRMMFNASLYQKDLNKWFDALTPERQQIEIQKSKDNA